MENENCVVDSFYGKLLCISVRVRRCAGAAWSSVFEGEVGHFGNT